MAFQAALEGGGTAARLWAAGAAALLVAAVVLHYRALRSRVSRRRGALLAVLRGAALALVMLLIVGPQAVRRTFQQVRRPVAVAIDTSRSMALRGGLATTRLERVQGLLESDAFGEVAEGYLPAYFSFAESLRSVVPADLGSLRPDGGRTDLDGAVREAGRAGEPAAVVVFTDGGHGAGAAARAIDAAPEVPVVLVGVGAGERTRDVEIAGVEPPAIAFAGQTVQLQIAVRSAGFAGREVPLLLKRGEQVLVSRPVVLPPDGVETSVALEWIPPAPGIYPLSVELPLQDGEQLPDNNRAELPIEAVRDKIRVLLVTGSPGWDYRFLRGALKGDPTLDVVSFIILRSASDAIDVPQQELSLIPFPTQKIFLEELSNFDLLIFDNFSYQPYLPSNYLEKVEEFVRGGGGFWMLGGPLSYLGGRYQRSPIAPLLPVQLPDAAPDGVTFHDVPVQPRLTPAGRNHPLFQGLASPGEPPPLQGYNVSGAPRPGAVVLADLRTGGGASQPLVVVGRYGRGRVLAVLTDALWNWAFEEYGRGRGNRSYLAFVRQAVRWSVGDPQLQPLRVEPERLRISPGEPMRARIRALGEDFLPATAPELAVTLRGPGGESRALAAIAEGGGMWRVEAGAAGEGTWEIAASATARGAVYARAAATVSVAWPPEESRAPGLNRAALAALLGGRRGVFLELGAPEETAEAISRALEELTSPGRAERSEPRPLAEMLPVFLLLLGLLAAEWTLRRRWGLD